MGWPYKKIVRPLLFAQDAERAHDFTLKILARASRDKFACNTIGKFFSAPELPVELFGLKFPNPVGLAAGMDKFAAAVPVWEKLGFRFLRTRRRDMARAAGKSAAANVPRRR